VKPGWKRILRWAGTLLSLGLFGVLLARQDWASLAVALRQMPVLTIPAALALYLAGQALNGLRWSVLLRAQSLNLSVVEAVRIFFAGAYASNFLPSTIGGDALRVLALLRYTPSKGLALASVALDRLINLAAFVTVLPLGIQFLASTGGPLELSLAVAALPRRIRGWLAAALREVVEAYRLWAARPGALLRAFAVSWASIFVVFLSHWLVAVGLGIPASLAQVMGITSLTYLLTLLPISINGYGLREVAITALYVRLGATLEQATALALITRFLMLLATVPGAFWAPGLMKDRARG
jgi:uncharacterized membrane protein YbhN (UPF0104 family)